jgi:lipopolysaccharide assembly protein A
VTQDQPSTAKAHDLEVPHDTTPADAAQSAAETGRPEDTAATDRIVRRSRVGTVWVAVVVFAIILIALLIFIVQNSQRVAVHFLTARGHMSLAVAMLFAAVAGVLLVAIPSGLRVVQLRKSHRRRRLTRMRADKNRG